MQTNAALLKFVVSLVCLCSSILVAQTNWTHVTEQSVVGYGVEGGWNGGSVFKPLVIKDGDTLRMWYTGINEGVLSQNKAIGYAWSVDGIEWHQYELNPLLIGFSMFGLSSGPVIMHSDTLKMWYGEGTDVRYATSLDGINWNPIPDVVLQPGSEGCWDSGSIPWGPCTVIKESNLYKMWYTGTMGAFPNTNVQIGLATSIDGIHWKKYDDPTTTDPPYAESDPVLKVGSEGEWDALHIKSCCVLQNETGYEMWYDGLSSLGPRQWIGYATSKNGISWTKWYKNPIIDSCPVWGNWGYLLGSVLKFDDQYHMWFASFDAAGDHPQIGYATAPIVAGPRKIVIDINGGGDFTSIQTGIDTATSGDTVLVKPGTYFENLNFNGKGICVMSQDGPKSTVIDGSQPLDPLYGSVVIFKGSEDSTAQLQGFTIANGTGGFGNFAGGIYAGGGIRCENGSSPTIERNIIRNNHADDGGGIGIYDRNSNPLIKQNIIWANEASTENPNFVSSGGGISVGFYAEPRIINNTIIGNKSLTIGGGIGIIQNGAPTIKNTIIADNMGAGICVMEGSPVISYCNVFNNSPNYSNTTSSHKGCISLDPMFVNPGNGDFSLKAESPCIDAGDPNSPLDIDGTKADIGAHVYYHASGPYVWINNFTINDIIGDNDQKVDVGETVDIIVALTNTGLDGSDINATLTTSDSDISILQAEANFGDMLKDESSTNANPFKIFVSDSTIDLTHKIKFYLKITGDNGYFQTDSIQVHVGKPILVIDDDIYSNPINSYSKILNKLDLIFEEWYIAADGGPSEIQQNYGALIWNTGKDRENSLTPDEQSSIMNYLDNGGKMIISGQNIGYDLAENGTPYDSLFYHNYLHANYLDDNSGKDKIMGVVGDSLTDDIKVVRLISDQNSPDVISPIEPATTIFTYFPGPTCAALRYEDEITKTKIVYMAFGIEGFQTVDEDIGYILIEKIHNWWLSKKNYPTKISKSSIAPNSYVLRQNFPNPFNPTTTIEYSVPRKSYVEIRIIDVLGREVRTLVASKHTAGTHHITWNGLDITGSPVASGVYFYQMTAEGFTETRKLLFIK